MIRLFEPVPKTLKDAQRFRQYQTPTIRHFHTGFGPSIADPMGVIKIVETSTKRNPVVDAPAAMVYWEGWRARLISWLIEKLLPFREMGDLTLVRRK